jgi:MFS family permease
MTQSIEKNIRLYPWYVGLFHAYFWLPIYFLFFNSRLELSEVLLLASFYFASVVVIEVPSGWFSDTFGRKKTLVTASCFLCTAYVLFLFANSFEQFAIAQMFLAGGIAFNSGTDTSFLLESTQSLGKEEVYAPCEARAMKFNFLGTAVASVFGGLAAIPDYRGAYVLSLIGGIGLLVITLQFKEPAQKNKEDRVNFFNQVISCFALLRNTRLLWLSFFAVFMIVINHIPYEFYQPYMEEIAKQYDALTSTPLLTSVHLTITMLIASWVASRSIRIKNKIGTNSTLLSAAGLQVTMTGLMHLYINLPVAVISVLRSCPRALMTAPLNVAVAPNVPASKRATFLSLQSLFGRLGFSATLAFFASIASGNDWAAMSVMLGWGMWGGLAGFALLSISALCFRSPE